MMIYYSEKKKGTHYQATQRHVLILNTHCQAKKKKRKEKNMKRLHGI